MVDSLCYKYSLFPFHWYSHPSSAMSLVTTSVQEDIYKPEAYILIPQQERNGHMMEHRVLLEYGCNDHQ